MKKELLILVILLWSQLALGQLVNYNWPKTEDIVSDKYGVRAREIQGQDTLDWVNITTLISLPRNYDDHPVYGGDASTEFLEDRSMSYVQFSFDGVIEVEVFKAYGEKASRVEILPSGFGVIPHYFDGEKVKFIMDKPEYLSINFVSSDNQDDDRFGGMNIKHGMMIFSDPPEEMTGDYSVPQIGDAGVVVWNNDLDIETIRLANVIYFPPGDHKMKDHKDNTQEDIYVQETMLNEPLYHGQLRLKKTQRIYIAGGAYVRGAFHAHGHNDSWLYGRGVVSGKDHWMHEIIKPTANGEYILNTQGKEAFVDFIGVDRAKLHGVVLTEAYHHTCPSGNNSDIKRIKILGFCSNNDGIRPGGDSMVDHIFIKTSDDYDYARSPHEVKNSVFWPGVNGAVGMLGWNNLGTGYAEYRNNYVINSEWSSENKKNTGIIGSVADDGMKLEQNILENYQIEGPTAYLINATLEEKGSLESGYLRDFTFKNMIADQNFALPNGKIVKQLMRGLENNWLEGFTFTNLIVGGVLVTWDNYQEYFDLDLTGSNGANEDASKFVKNVTFNSQGDLYEAQLNVGTGGSIYPNGSGSIVQMLGGLDQNFKINADEGYKIKEVLVDGESKGRIQNVLFPEVMMNHTIEVVFEEGEDYYSNTGSFYQYEFVRETEEYKEPEPILANQGLDHEKIILYPNPVEDTLMLKGLVYGQYVIVDGSGKKLIEGQDPVIDIRSLPNGFYYLITDTKQTFRFLKR
ncbi:T9SS type A sorting domain-containing protein [Reichenbachiella ulvae]|uniref:T9SS type A sorting domain-containing protein n=1 Tax=Reichenbachiella ulvae TaxID=2980104 RepID=A0ABT3D0C2_9BACT|nr:T9SS type A sorting domain-containing protein [Reichenbachiella ulvae]MCV9389266.1 T9SS type A sorting domain-containing protein [Reichenbachiella ulvae]